MNLLESNPRTVTVWNIRNVLMSAVALLSIFCLLVSGHVLQRAYVDRSLSARAANSNQTADLLLSSAGNWARERGATNISLNAAGPASDAQLDVIASYRKPADAAFDQVLGRIAEAPFANSDRLVAGARAAFERLVVLRQQADANMRRPSNEREAVVVAQWAPTITALIVASQNLRVAASMDEDDVQARLSSLQNLKHFVWIMSEFMGRERAMVAALVVAGRPMTASEVNTLGTSRGRVEDAWEYVQAYAAKASAPQSIADGVDHVRKLVFNDFEETRRTVLAAGFAGSAYPMAPSEWFNKATSAIDNVIELSQIASRESARLAENAQQDGLWTLMINGMLMAISLMLACVTLWVVLGRVVRPLLQMTGVMGRLAEGDLSVIVPCTERRDEIGSMGRAVLVFKEDAAQVRNMQAEKEVLAQRAADERKLAMNKLADEFERTVGDVIETVTCASMELQASAGGLSKTADNAQHLATMVASASEEASTNVHSVAAASEELSCSVSEISRLVHDSAMIAREAVEQALRTDSRIQDLSDAACRIGDVVQLITTIAAQTNLLALNATIEAARAGQAGRGFAVVASEVKALAEQTAKATGEISQQIAGIQSATQDSVEAIKVIGETIGRISEISSTIAAAVEEQGAATLEISRNVQQAAQGTTQVTSNIIDVQRGASETGSASSQVLSSAQSLSGESNRLKLEVGRFLATVRAA